MSVKLTFFRSNSKKAIIYTVDEVVDWRGCFIFNMWKLKGNSSYTEVARSSKSATLIHVKSLEI